MSFDSFPIHEVHELVNVAAAIAVKVGIVGVLVDVESENRCHAPNGIAVLGVPNVVKQLFLKNQIQKLVISREVLG